MINLYINVVMTMAHTGGKLVRRGSLLRRTDPAKTSWRGRRRCRGLPTGRRSLGTPLIRVKGCWSESYLENYNIMFHRKQRGAFFDIFRKRSNIFIWFGPAQNYVTFSICNATFKNCYARKCGSWFKSRLCLEVLHNSWWFQNRSQLYRSADGKSTCSESSLPPPQVADRGNFFKWGGVFWLLGYIWHSTHVMFLSVWLHIFYLWLGPWVWIM